MTIEYTTPLSNVRVSSAGLMIANADLIHIAIDLYRLGRALPNCALRDSLLHTDEEVLLTAEGAIQTLEYVGFDFESIGIDLAHLNFTATWEWFPLNDLYVGDAIMLLDFLKPYLSSPAPNEHPTIVFTDKALSKLFVEFPANKDTGNIYRVAKDGLPTTRTPINIIQRFNDLASLNRATETLNSIYKDFVDMEENVNKSWGNVETVLQRRYDLIPNLVNTVKGFAKQEKEVLTEVTALRSQWGKARQAGDAAASLKAASGLESALGRLMVVVEKYPELKSNENFLRLQDELAGTENRISVERRRYNETVASYNKSIRKFPGVIFANIFGFDKRDTFAATAGAEVAPTVEF